MKITRRIKASEPMRDDDFMEFELTEQELWEAYDEKRLKLALEDLELYLENRYDTEEERPEFTEAQKQKIAEMYLRAEDDWTTKMESAIAGCKSMFERMS